MFKKLKSIFNSEKGDTQKPLPEEDGVQTEVTEESAAEPSEVAEAAVDKQEAAAVVTPADEAVAEGELQQSDTVAAADTRIAESLPAAGPESEPEAETAPEIEAEVATEPVDKPEPEQKAGFFGRIKAGLSRTKANLTEGLGDLFLGAKQIDDELLEEIETQLLLADVGVEATTEIIGRLTERVKRKQLADADALYTALKDELASLLEAAEQPIDFSQSKGPFVLLMVGVNGVGKTTTIGKLAKKYQAEGKSVMLAAGDTFRAAAVEQLQVWGDRNNVPVVA